MYILTIKNKKKGGFIIKYTETKTFNLIDEPWIVVRKKNEETLEISLREALLGASGFEGLAGETETQDAAILRLLIAITHTVIERYAPDGRKEPLRSVDQALERWETIWEEEEFPEDPFAEYLDSVHDRFWLFSDEHPFMQTELAEKGTYNKAAKLVQSLSESANKTRLFQMRNGLPKEELDLPEAARWLVNVNGFDDTSAKASQQYRKNVVNKKSIGAGWLGKLGLIFAKGENLFQTLMLNTILVQPDGKLYNDDLPYWEIDKPDLSERREIAMPDNLAALLTLPSRRISLTRNPDGKVTGYYVIGGDFFPRENAVFEPFTVWKVTRNAKREITGEVPARHIPGRQFWRDFGKVISTADNPDQAREPGIVSWIKWLADDEMISDDYVVTFDAPTVFYGDKDFFVQDLGSQNMTLYAALLQKKGADWRIQIENQIVKIDKLAYAAGKLAQEISEAAGKTGDSLDADYAAGQAEAFRRVDIPFGRWISSLKPADENEGLEAVQIEEASERWEKQARNIAHEIERTLIRNSGSVQNVNALLGRRVQVDKDRNEYPSVPEAQMKFWGRVNRLYPKPAQEMKNDE